MGPPVRLSLEPDHPAVVHGPVHDRGRHVRVAEHASPTAELDVRGVDHALPLVRVGHDLEQEPGALLVDRHVAELVDHEKPGLGYRRELPVQPALGRRAQQPHDQSGRGEEPRRDALDARLARQRDREVGLPGPGWAEHHHVLAVGDEIQRFQRLPPVVDREADRRPVVAVELLDGRQAGPFEQARAFRPFPRRQLLVHPREHELHLGRGRGLQAVREHLPGQGQAPGEFHDLVHHPAGRRAPASGVGRGPRCPRHDSPPFPPGLLNSS